MAPAVIALDVAAFAVGRLDHIRGAGGSSGNADQGRRRADPERGASEAGLGFATGGGKGAGKVSAARRRSETVLNLVMAVSIR